MPSADLYLLLSHNVIGRSFIEGVSSNGFDGVIIAKGRNDTLHLPNLGGAVTNMSSYV